MAEVQNRHRQAAWSWQEGKGISHEKCADTLCAFCLTDGRDRDTYAQALADQEAEIAAALADMETPALVIEKGYNDGFQLGVLAAVTMVRSGEWRAGERTTCEACGRRSCMCQ